MTESLLSAESLLSVRGAHVAFGGEEVLRNVDLTVADGQVVTLIGPNGAGKTTLVRVALGLISPQAGTVSRRPGLSVGYMPQRLYVDETLPLTVHRFLKMGARRSKAEMEATLEEVGVLSSFHKPIQTLSGGETQRVLLARALLRQPDLLVLDEPVQGVDVGGQADFYALIQRIRDERGCGILMVSHDLHLVMAATDQVVCLNQHVCCEGHPESVSQDPAYVDLFGATAAETLAVYHHHHDHHHGVDGHVGEGETCDHG